MFVYDGAGHIDLVLDTIATTPEPGTWVAGALALGALAWRQARKVRRKKDELRSGRAVRNEFAAGGAPALQFPVLLPPLTNNNEPITAAARPHLLLAQSQTNVAALG